MFPVHLKLTISNATELARVTAFLANDSAALAANVAQSTETAQAPGKASAAKAARSSPTAEAGQSKPGPSADAPEKSTEVTKPAAAATSAKAPPEVTYADLRAEVIALHKLDPKAPEGIAKAMGKNTFKDMIDEPDLWPTAIAKVKAKAAELSVA